MARTEKEKRAFERRFDRVTEWAMQQSHADLVSYCAALFSMQFHFKKRHRELTSAAREVSGVVMVYSDAYREARESVALHRQQRVKGSVGRWANDPSQVAKEAAIALWPKAEKHGWTAAKMHTALVEAGHVVPFTTVQKWMPKLRKGTL